MFHKATMRVVKMMANMSLPLSPVATGYTVSNKEYTITQEDT